MEKSSRNANVNSMMKKKLNDMWTLEYADEQFSRYIRRRDSKCQYPYCNKTEGLDNSHFHLRGHSATRFDPDNCIALCRTHHQQLEVPQPNKNPEYIALMLARLGKEKFIYLSTKANGIYKRTQAILDCMKLVLS